MADTEDTRTRQVDDWGFDDVEARKPPPIDGSPSPETPQTPAGAPSVPVAPEASAEEPPADAPTVELKVPAEGEAPARAKAEAPVGRAASEKGRAPAKAKAARGKKSAKDGGSSKGRAGAKGPGAAKDLKPVEDRAAAAGKARDALEEPAATKDREDGGLGARVWRTLAALVAVTEDPCRKQKKVAGPGAETAVLLDGAEPAPRGPWPQRLKAFARRHAAAVAFFGLWSLILAFPYFGLGSASFVVLHDTSEMNLPRAVWYGAADTQTGMGAWSVTGVSGTDRLGSGLSRDLDTFLFVVLPGWLAYGLFMWLQRFLAGFFLFRLLRDWRNVSPAAAACVSCAYALFTQPHYNMSWTGFALYDGLALPGLPLVLYLLFRCERWRPRCRYPAIAAAGLLYALSSHFFLAVFCVAAAVVLAMAAFPHRSRRYFWVAPLLFAAAWFVGELPVLWAAAANAGASQRADRALLTLNTQDGVAYRQWLPKFLMDNLLALVLTAIAFVLALVRRSWHVLVVAALAGLCVLAVAYAPFFRDSVFSHLGPLSGFRFDRLFVVLPFMALFAGGLGLGLLPRATPALVPGATSGRASWLRRKAGPQGDAAGEAPGSVADKGAAGSGEAPAAAGQSPRALKKAARSRTVIAAEVHMGPDGDGRGERVFVLTKNEMVEPGDETAGDGAGADEAGTDAAAAGQTGGDRDKTAEKAAARPAANGSAEGAEGVSPGTSVWGRIGAATRETVNSLLPRRGSGLPVQAAVGVAILVAVVVQAVGVQQRVAGEMSNGATYATLYGSPDIAALAAKQSAAPPFRVASVNAPLARGKTQTWHAGYAWAYGLETADGYCVLYSQRYQDFWLRVIDAKIGRSEAIKDHFRKWGNRVYLFTSRNYLNRPGGIRAANRWNLALLSLANVRYFISPVQLRDPSLKLVPSGNREAQLAWSALTGWQKTTRTWDGEYPGLPLYIYENDDVFPRAFLVQNVRLFSSRKALLDQMARASHEGLRGSVFLTTADRNTLGLDETPLGSGGAQGTDGEANGEADGGTAGGANGQDAAVIPASAVKITKYAVDEVEMTVQADGAGVVVLANTYSRFWKATVDGEEVAVVPADYTFLGAVVPDGRHTVVFKYRPPYRWLAWQ